VSAGGARFCAWRRRGGNGGSASEGRRAFRFHRKMPVAVENRAYLAEYELDLSDQGS
jgi:hypothetical protein